MKQGQFIEEDDDDEEYEYEDEEEEEDDDENEDENEFTTRKSRICTRIANIFFFPSIQSLKTI